MFNTLISFEKQIGVGAHVSPRALLGFGFADSMSTNERRQPLNVVEFHRPSRRPRSCDISPCRVRARVIGFIGHCSGLVAATENPVPLAQLLGSFIGHCSGLVIATL